MKRGIFVALLILLLITFVIADFDPDLNRSPSNHTFITDTTPTFTFNVTGANESYTAELFLNSTGYGTTSATNATTASITANSTLSDGNYYWVINATNGTITNTTDNYLIIIDTTVPLVSLDSSTSGLSASRAHLNADSLFVNVSVTEANEANITFSLTNSSGTAQNTSSFTTGNRTLNFTSLTAETYNISVVVWDNATHSNCTSRVIILNDKAVGFNSTTLTNGSYSNSLNLFLSVAINGTGPINATFNVRNLTALANSTTQFYSDSTNFTYNITNIAETIYFINYTVAYSNGTVLTSEERTVTMDRTAPTMTATVSAEALNPNEATILSCSASDAFDYSVATVMAVRTPGASTFTTVTSTTYGDTTTGGTYTFRCQGTDNANNVGYGYKNFTVTSVTSTSSSTSESSSGGGGSSVAPLTAGGDVDLSANEIWTNERAVSVSNLATGSKITAPFISSTKVQETHTITVDSVDTADKKVTLTIESDPVQIILEEGDIGKVDVDKDSIDDLAITINSITADFVEIDLQVLGEWTVEEVSEEESILDLESLDETLKLMKGPWTWWKILIVSVLGLLAVLGIVLIILKVRRGPRIRR